MIKKGSLYATIAVISTILLVGVAIWAFAVGGYLVQDAIGEIAPELRAIGTVGGANFTQSLNFVLDPIETIVNNYQIYATMLYGFGMILVFSMAFMFRNSLNGWTIGFFIVCIILLITISIIMSNTYEQLYDGTDELAIGLKNAPTLSYLILYSPTILTIIAFIAGIIMMTGGSRGGTGI